MHAIYRYFENKKDQNKDQNKNVEQDQIPKQMPDNGLVDELDLELVAVIAATVAAAMNTSTYNLKIRSIRQVGSNTPLWNMAGRSELINNKL